MNSSGGKRSSLKGKCDICIRTAGCWRLPASTPNTDRQLLGEHPPQRSKPPHPTSHAARLRKRRGYSSGKLTPSAVSPAGRHTARLQKWKADSFGGVSRRASHCAVTAVES
ncbi:hypothetical protein P7K49_029970 [Saguinus oedipus]|uniref:Uncharacterized protein n=1 Tax=Saguinus oedipus TaxID=9490 RepID=A0ABQ9U970_SAGOE|nr:hypothetical protein P7K49_029970 [Saguinus oedipus]